VWPWLLSTRNVSAVTGACLAIPTDLFAALGGFDMGYPSNYNDVDLCFRARERGYEVVCAAVPGLVHAECQTRRGSVRFEERYRLYRRWGSILDRPDPFYSPNLAPTEEIALDLASEL
jgi:GT2 family glycosyltransferase